MPRKSTSIVAAFIVAFHVAVLNGPADDGDHTLRYFLSKSELAIAGKIASEPVRHTSEVGVVSYSCRFTVTDVLKGKDVRGRTLQVSIVRFGGDEDRPPELNKGAKCILFLKNYAKKGQPPVWGTADNWFGIQRFGPWMARSLKRLVEK